MAQIYDQGDPVPRRTLTFQIEATDEGETHGLPVYERRTLRNWRPIGIGRNDRQFDVKHEGADAPGIT